MQDRRRPPSGDNGPATTPATSASFSSGIDVPRPRGLRRLFQGRDVPPDDTCRWIIDVYAWLLANTGGFAQFEENPLVLPTDEFFPVATRLRGDELAQALFERVTFHAGLGPEWKFRVAPLEGDASTVDLLGENVPFGASAPRTGSVSSISFQDDATIIYYAPYLLDRVELFVGAMAYELAHVLLLAPAQDSVLPGVDELEGVFLEVAATFLGFGVFTANSVFNLETIQGPQTQGWNVHSLGVLSEIEVSYALALFLALQGDSFREVKEHLRPNPRSYVRSSLSVLERDGEAALAALRSIKAAKQPEV